MSRNLWVPRSEIWDLDPWTCGLVEPLLWVAESPKPPKSPYDYWQFQFGDHPVSPSAAAVKYFVIFICKSCLTTLYEFVCSMGIFIVPLIEYANAFSHVGPQSRLEPAPLHRRCPSPVSRQRRTNSPKKHWCFFFGTQKKGSLEASASVRSTYSSHSSKLRT